MSLEELNQLRRRLEEEQRLRVEEQRLREEEQRLREEVQLQLNQERLQTQPTTLPEFLDACHVHLFLGLIIQKDKKTTTKGAPENADNKIRPDKIREWKTFPSEQSAIWADLMDSDFVVERHFTPLLALRETGNDVREKMLSSELDLGYFERQTLELRVASVVKKLYENPQLRQTFHMNGNITFENHANTLTDESQMVTDMSSLSLLPEQPRLAASRSSHESNQNPAQAKSSRPRADQFCVYNRGTEEKVPAFTIEYKAPHKVSLAHIQTGLQDMELDEVIRYQKKKTPEQICKRVLAAVVTQQFSYMIQCGNEYGYVCTGEAFIFLRVLREDPSTVYYYLSVQKEDVGETTGWTGNLNADNRLHLTALGQVLAFTLRALRTPPRDISWRNRAADGLKRWEMVYDDLLNEIKEDDISSTPFPSPRQSRNEYCRSSPVKTRAKSALASTISCNPSRSVGSPDDDDDSGDGFDPNTPTRKPRNSRHTAPPGSRSLSSAPTTSHGSRSKGKSRQYCTQLCLRGLLTGGKLDLKCPNVLEHGADRHQIDPKTLLHLLDEQLSSNGLPTDLELGCESLHIHGSRGALFKITLWSHGYTFVGKGMPVEFIKGAIHEESVYSRLTQIQGVHLPVLLGSLRLRRPFSYDGIAEIVHMLFMSYAGRTLAKPNQIDRTQLLQQAENSLRAIHQLDVLQGDPIPGNMIWNEEDGRVMFIDFERATLRDRRTPLGSISPNQKRKWEARNWGKSSNKRWNPFAREHRRMRNELLS